MKYTHDGYYDGYFVGTNPVKNGSTLIRIQGKYTIDNFDQNLKPGSTVVICPVDDGYLQHVCFGRFIVESIPSDCGDNYLTVISCTSLRGDAIIVDPLLPPAASQSSTSFSIPVRIYFSYDSINLPENIPSVSMPNKSCIEVFASKDGKVFTHKRALMESANTVSFSLSIGCTTISDIRNYGWHIISVSPKFRGYSITNNTEARRFVRLFILGGDSNNMSAYIGQPNDHGTVDNPGVVSIITPGKICRLYDNTGIDYIDILFDIDPTLNESWDIDQYSYVDIEIFETLQTLISCLVLT
jgi:hypothetical protein